MLLLYRSSLYEHLYWELICLHILCKQTAVCERYYSDVFFCPWAYVQVIKTMYFLPGFDKFNIYVYLLNIYRSGLYEHFYKQNIYLAGWPQPGKNWKKLEFSHVFQTWKTPGI